MSALDTTIVATTYIPIGNALNSLDIAEWIITSYLISVTAFQPLYGAISDLLGRIETLIFAVLVFLLGSIICAVSTSMPMLIASRAVQGIGGAGLMSMALIIVADIINERERSKYVGVFSGTYGIAAAIGPVIGGAIVQNAKWQVVFWINIPFCVIALIMIVPLLCIPRPQGTLVEKLKRIDFIGALLCIAGIVSLLLGLSWGGREYSWSSVQVICTLVFGLLGMALFAWYESKLPLVPIVPIHLFKIRNVACASGSSLLFGFAVNGAFMFIPQWAQIVKQASPVVSGAYLAPYCVGMIISSTICGVLVSRTGRCYEFIIGGAATMLLGNGLLIMLGSGNNELGKVIGFLLICGLGMGACVFTINLIGQASVSGKHMAVATSTFLFFRSLGMVLSVSVLSNIIQNVLRDRISDFAKDFPMFVGDIGDILKDHALLYGEQVPQLFIDDFISAYSQALRSAFIALTAFTGLFFAVSFGFKHAELHTVLKI
ncbi:hypothetical protein IWW36_001053 [Coemansia brasiliensis]|uniref:Major facilitator superfamily (MFS) profile domain-containing protein n=1 Tax=Coemansia brasiliensis TaxID=2650707 RepID=A0A9W8IES0_9FUNG|nr:hypothetical protein IWW36_001053 [Coemansia brasiliensis]